MFDSDSFGHDNMKMDDVERQVGGNMKEADNDQHWFDDHHDIGVASKKHADLFDFMGDRELSNLNEVENIDKQMN